MQDLFYQSSLNIFRYFRFTNVIPLDYNDLVWTYNYIAAFSERSISFERNATYVHTHGSSAKFSTLITHIACKSSATTSVPRSTASNVTLDSSRVTAMYDTLRRRMRNARAFNQVSSQDLTLGITSDVLLSFRRNSSLSEEKRRVDIYGGRE